MKKSDTQIDLEVIEELEWDTRLDASSIDVQTRSGVVSLKGIVDSWAARRAAEEAAHRVNGVLDVANDLLVTPRGWDGRTDTEIAQAVRHALEWDVLVPHERIHSTVAGGAVTLEGVVESVSKRDDAERAIRNLAGVRDVRNEITVEPPDVEPAQLRAAIERALERHAVHAAKHLEIEVHGGDVILRGDVPLSERAAVVGAVTGTRGVRHVDDHQLNIRKRLPRGVVLGP
jgi:osmotically-inducible protein OsmY